jgi:hypothetical protein
MIMTKSVTMMIMILIMIITSTTMMMLMPMIMMILSLIIIVIIIIMRSICIFVKCKIFIGASLCTSVRRRPGRLKAYCRGMSTLLPVTLRHSSSHRHCYRYLNGAKLRPFVSYLTMKAVVSLPDAV